ncbi:threonine--tRNA ligase [Alphaproteobacteria bacterium]|nr:threonine--tRNA ligase [Alphaproteobacteria bacterium]
MSGNKNLEELAILRHSTAHILAAALFEIDRDIEFAIGPSVENGFYYDIKSKKTFSPENLAHIEDKMREIISRNLDFERIEISKNKAKEIFSANHQYYKLEILDSIPDDTVSIYKFGEFVDLCRGPHIKNSSFIPSDAFKLTAVAGAYWRGDSSNDMLQRIYGTAFFDKKSMESYFNMLEEAQLRDHRKLGVDLDLFHIDEQSPGSVFWLKNGFVLFNLVKNYIADVIKKYGYFLVQTPQLLNRSLWEISGHWEKFQENMFVVQSDETTMAIKPMNCPGHITIYNTGPLKSYRDLPIRMAEFGLCHRNEPSGSLHGLMRLRAFMQDDGHIFCTPDQVISETQKFCNALKEVYSTFGFHDIFVKFSDRPSTRAGSDDIWDIAEKSLKEAAIASQLSFSINKGEGAFYGPKLEFVLKDCLGRDWQCGTLQVDFVLPARFGITYVDSSGQKQPPVMIHRALVGSLERFIGILIENYAGKFPFWLAPIQIVVASITGDSIEYANSVYELLSKSGFRIFLDIENEKITYKIRTHSIKKIPALIIVGQNEEKNQSVSIRLLGSPANTTMSLSESVDFFYKLLINHK